MPAAYPDAIYEPRTKENKDGVVYAPLETTKLFAEDVVYDDQEIVAIETELGTNPKGSAADVAERLDNIEADIADLPAIQSKSFVITNPTAAADLPLWRAPYAITILAVHLLCKGNVVVGQLAEGDSNGNSLTAIDVSNITGIVDTNVNDDGALSSPSIESGNYVGWLTASVTGTPTYAIVTFDYILT